VFEELPPLLDALSFNTTTTTTTSAGAVGSLAHAWQQHPLLAFLLGIHRCVDQGLASLDLEFEWQLVRLFELALACACVYILGCACIGERVYVSCKGATISK
jgi:hypothetical protein